MAMAYHWDALRKQRVLERKNEAIQRMTVAGSENPVPSYITAPNDPMDNLKSVDPEQFNNIRCEQSVREITHDPNFKYRVFKGTPSAPIHVDPIYKIIYPGSYRVEKN